MSKKIFVKLILTVTALCLTAPLGYTQTARPDETATKERTAWWREARFGMFIHWGLYAVPAGEWKGGKTSGYSEWIMHKKRIPVEEYEQLAEQFNPVKFNAEEWVKLAKAAGMKYMVITSKHHDGFAMYHSRVSPYNVVDATPFKRDPIKELAEACRKEGIKFGCYYSIDRDWHHPDAFCSNQGQGNTWDYPDDSKKDFNKYLREKALPQVREILTQYGPLGIIWFDGVGTKTAEQNEEIIAMVRELQPYCLINSRLGDWKSFKWGDYRSMDDNKVADELLPYGWENPGTINETYGYNKHDKQWKSPAEIVQILVDIASKGGNYLLNVGPKADGTIPAESVSILREVGKWMDKNSESIYGTTASPFGRLPWGRCTAKPGKLYLHVFDWPKNGELEVRLPRNDVIRAYLLAYEQRGDLLLGGDDRDNLVITIPRKAPDPIDAVVVLEKEAEPEATPQAKDGSVSLKAMNAVVRGKNARYESGGGKDNIGYWTNPNDYVTWAFEVITPGTFNVEVSLACANGVGGSEYTLLVAGQELTGTVKDTGGWTSFATEKLGTLKLTKAGTYTLSVKPKTMPRGAVMNLKSVTLVPIKK